MLNCEQAELFKVQRLFVRDKYMNNALQNKVCNSAVLQVSGLVNAIVFKYGYECSERFQ